MSEFSLTGGTVTGEVTVPPSKSIAHRMLISAGLACGKSRIENIYVSEDIEATAEAMRALGSEIKFNGSCAEVLGCGFEHKEKNEEIFCNESGSTLRFMIPVALSFGGSFLFKGSKRLLERPLNAYYEICKKDGISYSKTEKGVVFSGKLKGGKYMLRGDVSSQYITGLLFALPMLKCDSEIIITTELESAGYIDLTLEALSQFGINIIRNKNNFFIPKNQKFKANNVTVEGDYSQAAFYLVLNALKSNVKLLGLNPNSRQGDKEIINVIEKMKNGGITLDVRQIPDLVPVITVLATQTEGITHITNAARLRIKESDRLSAITSELKKMGADIKEEADGLIIKGKTKLKGAEVYAHNDHRIAMSLAVAGTVSEGETVIKNAECVKKSYGAFWQDFSGLKKTEGREN